MKSISVPGRNTTKCGKFQEGVNMKGIVGSFISYMVQHEKLMILDEAHSVIYNNQLKDFRVETKCSIKPWMNLQHRVFKAFRYSTNSPQ